MILKRYCACGTVLSVVVPKAKRDQALRIWYAAHDGAGHGDGHGARDEEGAAWNR